MSDICCYTIISEDLNLLNWCIANAKDRAGRPHSWLIVNWQTTHATKDQKECYAEIKQYCKDKTITYVPIKLPPKPELEDPQVKTDWFLKSLYACWNLGYEKAETKWVVRMGSDQFFSPGWLNWLMVAADLFGDNAIYHCWTIESDAVKHSRHPVEPWGQTWDTFDTIRFDGYCKDRIQRYQHTPIIRQLECNLYFRHPTRGLQLRPDGVTWLQTRDMWESFGPMSDVINEEGVTGDVSYMDRMLDAMIPMYLVPCSTSYHLVRGESRTVQV